MKKYLIALSAFTIIAVAANAQSTDNSTKSAPNQQNNKMHGHRPGYGMNRHRGNFTMMRDINLTDAQKQQARALNEDYQAKVKNLERDENITLKDYCAKKASLEQERKSKFQALLTPEQKDKIAQDRKARSEKIKVIAQKRLDKMKTDLNLTDEQVAKIQEQRNTSIEKMKAIRENSSLSDDQKKEQLMDLRKSMHDSMNSILTADQIKKRDEMRNNRMSDWKNKRVNKES
jgi:Spy/CpxP family protein refolding chaperone